MKEYKETQHSIHYKSLSDLSFYSAGYEKCKPSYSYGPKYRNYQLIHFVLSGEGTLHINEQTFNLKQGDAFLIPSGKISYYKASATNPWCYTWISFLGINSQNYIYQMMKKTDDIYIIHNLDITKYKTLIDEIINLQENNVIHYLKANSLLFLILAQLFEDINLSENEMQTKSLANDLKFYFDVNYAEKLILKDIAKKFGIHPNYLTRIFHEKFHLSPKQYIMQLKLKKARSLLITTELSISIIASSLGFDDQLAFSRTFKKEFSISPSMYRKYYAEK